MNAVTMMNVPMSQVFWLDSLNYRRGLARTHKPEGATPDLAADGAMIYSDMVELATKTGQPWASTELVQVVPIAQAKKVFGMVNRFIVAEIATWDEDDARHDIYGDGKEVKYIAVFGFCRRFTAIDAMAAVEGDVSTIVVPIVVEDYVSASQFYAAQLRENEKKNIGARKTDTLDQWFALTRAIDCGSPKPEGESDIAKILQCKRGTTQKIWAIYRLATIVDNGFARLAMVRPKDSDGKQSQTYDTAGFIPLRSIRPQDLRNKSEGLLASLEKAEKALGEANTKAETKEADVNLDEARIETQVACEKYISQLVRGKIERVPSMSVGDWRKVRVNSKQHTFLRALADSAIDGTFNDLAARYAPLFELSTKAVRELVAEQVLAEAK